MLEQDLNDLLDRSKASLDLMAGTNVLMSGAGGFLGRYFVSLVDLYNQNHDLKIAFTGIDNFAVSKPNIGISSSNEFIKILNGNVCDPSNFADIKNSEYIISAAGIASPFYYRAMPLETLNVSVLGTQNLLELAERNNSRLTFFSSSEIYGNPTEGNVPTAESYKGNVACLGPRACYDESKRLGETLCYIYSNNKGVHTNIIRPFNICGPGMHELDYRVFPNFASCLKKHRDLVVYGDGDQTRTFCYIVDAIDGFLKVITSGVMGSPYNIGNPYPEISMIELANLFLEISGSKASNLKLVGYPDTYPEDEPRRRCPDITKATRQLGYKPTVDIETSIKKFLTWSEENYSV